jgi:hypothetical protein
MPARNRRTRAHAAVVAVLALAGAASAVLATGVADALRVLRHDRCDGTLPMPLAGWWYGWLGVVVALAAVVVAALRFRRHGSPVPLLVAVPAFLLAVFVLVMIFRDAAPNRPLCFG